MWLQRLDIKNLRNLVDVKLHPSPRLNIIEGLNGSGKTSLLESIYLLSCGKSFRTHRFSNLPTQGCDWMGVYGKISGKENRIISVGLEHRNGKNFIKAEGNRLQKASELANYLPIVVIHQESHRVFTQSPKYRRAFVDWGVFHVEQNFLSTWQYFSRTLKQRNAALSQRNSTMSLDHWDLALHQSALLIDDFRQEYLNKLIPLFNHYAAALLSIDDEITIEYKRGWSDKEDYLSVLNASIGRDRLLGYTQKGPHRADITFKVCGVPLHEFISRGQQKLLVCSLYIAQAALFSKLTGQASLFVIDDVTAELDNLHVDNLMKVLNGLEVQIFVTTPDKLLVDSQLFPETKMFHVEHGIVTEVV